MKKTSSAVMALAAAGVVLAAGAGAAYVYGRRPVAQTSPANGGLAEAVPSSETANPVLPPTGPPDQPATTSKLIRSAVVYRVDASGTRLAPATVNLRPSAGEPMSAALNAMAAFKNSPLPPGTRALSARLDPNGVVTVDFNKAFQENFPGGDTEEALTLGAVVGALAHFQGVERVQVLVEGQKINTLGGNQELTDPLPARDNPLLARAEGQGGEAGGE